MFQVAAHIMDKKSVRIIFTIIGVIASVLYIPYALFAIAVGIPIILDFDAPDYGKYNSYAFIGLGSLCGIVAAWARVLTSNEALRRSKVLRFAVIIGLAFGIAVGLSLAWPLAADPGFIVFWVYIISVVIGVFLMASTIGVKDHST